METKRTAADHLDADEHAAAMAVVRRVRRRVRAELVQALLFGSHARGEARDDSDVDVLLVFRRLPPDREPHAGDAERIADAVADETGVPVGVWSVSVEDFARGRRTPMLVDALEDAAPLWPRAMTVPRVAFTPEDAAFCAARLLDRVDEGADEVAARRADADGEWPRRLRDDLVRACTAALLLAGETRPRRGDAVRGLLDREPGFAARSADRAVLAWAARSYPDGHLELDDDHPVPPPPVPFPAAAAVVDRVVHMAARRGRRARRTGTFARGGGWER